MGAFTIDVTLTANGHIDIVCLFGGVKIGKLLWCSSGMNLAIDTNERNDSGMVFKFFLHLCVLGKYHYRNKIGAMRSFNCCTNYYGL